MKPNTNSNAGIFAIFETIANSGQKTTTVKVFGYAMVLRSLKADENSESLDGGAELNRDIAILVSSRVDILSRAIVSVDGMTVTDDMRPKIREILARCENAVINNIFAEYQTMALEQDKEIRKEFAPSEPVEVKNAMPQMHGDSLYTPGATPVSPYMNPGQPTLQQDPSGTGQPPSPYQPTTSNNIDLNTPPFIPTQDAIAPPSVMPTPEIAPAPPKVNMVKQNNG